jgi:hypothetical protein
MICTRLLFFKVLISQVPSFASSMSSGHEHLLALIACVISSVDFLYTFFLLILPSLCRDVTFGVSIPGVALSVLLLIAIAYLQWNTCSRPYLNRVSFRLLTYALVAK